MQNQYCKWTWNKESDKAYARVQCKGYDKVNFDMIRLFNYCPYCGRKLDIVKGIIKNGNYEKPK